MWHYWIGSSILQSASDIMNPGPRFFILLAAFLWLSSLCVENTLAQQLQMQTMQHSVGAVSHNANVRSRSATTSTALPLSSSNKLTKPAAKAVQKILVLPDFLISRLSVTPTKIHSGGKITVHAVIKNIGSTTYQRVLFRVVERRSRHTIGQKDVALRAGIDTQTSLQIRLTGKGLINLEAVIDPDRRIAELNERNNSLSTQVHFIPNIHFAAVSKKSTHGNSRNIPAMTITTAKLTAKPNRNLPAVGRSSRFVQPKTTIPVFANNILHPKIPTKPLPHLIQLNKRTTGSIISTNTFGRMSSQFRKNAIGAKVLPKKIAGLNPGGSSPVLSPRLKLKPFGTMTPYGSGIFQVNKPSQGEPGYPVKPMISSGFLADPVLW